MAYHLIVFNPETWRAFLETGARTAVFSERYLQAARTKVRKGDTLVCYLTRLSRWCGLLHVDSAAYQDDSFLHDDLKGYPVRFKVSPSVLLEFEKSIPINDEVVWDALTFTRQNVKGTSTWTGFLRTPLNTFREEDGHFLRELLTNQKTVQRVYPLSGKDLRKPTARTRFRSPTPDTSFPVSEDEATYTPPPSNESAIASDDRVSIRYQAKVAEIGARMGFNIWIPRSDKVRVLEHVTESLRSLFLDTLPLTYERKTLKTIENIDVIWLRGTAMARAFEVEHTTAIYSGLLRMADLLEQQPNMDIRLHIVAPSDKKARVLREINRPAFRRVGRGPLFEQCSYLSYESVDALGNIEHLDYVSDAIIREYEESAIVSSN